MESENRSFDYKKGITAEEARRKREDGLLNLRQTIRMEALAKRRQITPAQAEGGDVAGEPELEKLFEVLRSNDETAVYNAAIAVRKIVSNKQNPPIDAVVRSGIVPRLVELLSRSENERLLYEVTWVVTNVASGTSEQAKLLVEQAALPALTALLASPNDELAEQACWALSNIAGDCAELRDAVLAAGVLGPLLGLLMRSTRDSVVRTCAWTLSNLCRSKPEPPLPEMRRCLPVLAGLLDSADADVVADAAWALSFVCDESTKENLRIQAVLDSGVLPRVVQLLADEKTHKTVRMPLLRVVGNVVTGSDEQTQQVLGHGALPALARLLAVPGSRLRKEAVWTCSNIAAGTREQMQTLIESGVVRSLVQGFAGESFDVKKEICWVLSNVLASGDPGCSKHIVDSGGLKTLCDMLLSSDMQALLVALEGIGMVLDTGREIAQREHKRNEWADAVEQLGGLDKIEQAQECDDPAVYNKALEIVTKHFGFEDALGEAAPHERGAGEQSLFEL